jgi:hypothetical protein
VNEKTLEVPMAENASLQAHFKERRDALLNLHKTLLESERVSYEKIFGKIHSPYQLLQLVTNDPWFAWLHPFSQLLAAIDEKLGGKKPGTRAELDDLFNQVHRLLIASEIGEGFSRHYFDALQRDPDVVFAHAPAAKLLREKKAA